jgi:hypothetical protein
VFYRQASAANRARVSRICYRKVATRDAELKTDREIQALNQSSLRAHRRHLWPVLSTSRTCWTPIGSASLPPR